MAENLRCHPNHRVIYTTGMLLYNATIAGEPWWWVEGHIEITTLISIQNTTNRLLAYYSWMINSAKFLTFGYIPLYFYNRINLVNKTSSRINLYCSFDTVRTQFSRLN
ncbi:hypothetical protein [Terrimonas pollutisoli]|uniref:hypothetical protein n=1 Tax=Terrimonas pollutisoli TaxID=3034147 RepID=UPI0023EADCF5|nr:hypothetical protein [Terrimonas sp. H1YJ31]